MSQVEALMYVALGAVLALIMVFAFGRTVWSLSTLYAKRKRDKDLPATMLELQAEKNRLRAENAMMNRKLEVGTEEMKAQVVTQMAEVNRHRNRLMGMSETLEENTAELESKTAEAAALQQGLDEALNDLAEHKKMIGTLQDTLAERDRAIVEHEVIVSEKNEFIGARNTRLRELEAEVERLTDLLDTTVRALEESNQHAADLETRLLDMKMDAAETMAAATREAEESSELPVMQPPNNTQPFNNFETRRRIAEIAAKAAAGNASAPPRTNPKVTRRGPNMQAPASNGRRNNEADAGQPNEFKSLIAEARGVLTQSVQSGDKSAAGKEKPAAAKSSAVANVVSLAQRIRALQKKNDDKLTKDLK